MIELSFNRQSSLVPLSVNTQFTSTQKVSFVSHILIHHQDRNLPGSADKVAGITILMELKLEVKLRKYEFAKASSQRADLPVALVHLPRAQA